MREQYHTRRLAWDIIRIPILSNGKTTILTKMHDTWAAFDICAGGSWIVSTVVNWLEEPAVVQGCVHSSGPVRVVGKTMIIR